MQNEKYTPVAFEGGSTPIPPAGKVIGKEELQNMVDASLDGWLTTGRFNQLFEKKLANFLGVKYCLSVNSGSSANLVAFSALTSPKLGDRAIKKGDEVIGVAAGFPTTVNQSFNLELSQFLWMLILKRIILILIWLKQLLLLRPKRLCWHTL